LKKDVWLVEIERELSDAEPQFVKNFQKKSLSYCCFNDNINKARLSVSTKAFLTKNI